MKLILASASPRRRELLGMIAPAFETAAADVDESGVRAANPCALARALAQKKCAAAAQAHPHDVVIGSDTVVDVDGRALGKPHSRDEARQMLRALRGRTHFVRTGVCIRCGAAQVLFTDTTAVMFAPLTDEEIERYIATDEPYDKAGGYGVQGGAAKFVRRLSGCYYNAMGFPVRRVYAVLKKFCPQLLF